MRETTKRIKVDKRELKNIQKQLKKENYTLDAISDYLDADFRNFRYKGHSMTRETFYRLKELYSGTIDKKEINYIDGKG